MRPEQIETVLSFKNYVRSLLIRAQASWLKDKDSPTPLSLYYQSTSTGVVPPVILSPRQYHGVSGSDMG